MKRRSRFFPTPKGQRVGSPRHLAVLNILQQYDCLPANYIRAAIPGTYTQKVINLLNQEGYIAVPEEAKNHINARYRPTIFEITPKGEALLLDNDLWLGRRKSMGHFRHKHMVSVVEFSFRQVKDATFKTQQEILDRAPWKPTTNDPNFAHIPLGNYKVIPDAPLFGLTMGGTTMHFHGFEADRGTEPLTSDHNGRTNITTKVQNYATYLRGRLVKNRYGLHRITILFVTLSLKRAYDIRNIIDTKFKDVAHHFQVKAIPDFKETFPPPTDHMASEDWIGGFNIIEALRKAHGLRETLGKDKRVA